MKLNHLKLGLIVGLALLPGCGFIRNLAGTNTVDLEKADVKSMSVDLRKPKKTICPREQVQMAVFADVSLEGEKGPKPFETWAGRGSVNKNDKIDFKEFAFQSGQGAFDGDGWFQPNPNLLASASKEFEIKTVFKRRPDKFTFSTNYKPDYSCISGAGTSGQSGMMGQGGNAGQAGTMGQSGSSTGSGGPGRDGGSGGQGGNGTDGAAGPRIVVLATMVKTAFYDKLVALRIAGDMEDFLLVPVDQPVVLRANGGAGGQGGQGGQGGSGGSGGSGNPGGQGGSGGPGANGGNGGNGGPGGSIELIYDSRFPEIASHLTFDVAGGHAGEAGQGGQGGSTGRGGSSQGQGAQNGKDGAGGPQASGGAQGRSGANGRGGAKSGDVKNKFSDLPGITPL